MVSKRPIANETNKTYKATGVVVCNVSPAVGGLHVRIVDKNVTGDVELVTTVTNDRGAYSVSFDDSGLKKRKKSKPDLQAQVFAGEKSIGASEVRYNASASETLNVTLGTDILPALRSEYEALTAAITDLFKENSGTSRKAPIKRKSPTWPTKPAGMHGQWPWLPWRISSAGSHLRTVLRRFVQSFTMPYFAPASLPTQPRRNISSGR